MSSKGKVPVNCENICLMHFYSCFPATICLGVFIFMTNDIKNVHFLLAFVGSVLRCDVTGKILMKCFLSGMPDLKLGLNDKIGLEKESQLKSRPAKR